MHVFLLIVQPKASFRVDQTKLLQQPFCLPAWNYFLSWKVNLHMPTLAQHAKYCIKTESCTDSALRGPDRIGGTLDSWRIRIPGDGSYLITYKKNIINVALYNWKLNDGKESCWFQTVWSNRNMQGQTQPFRLSEENIDFSPNREQGSLMLDKKNWIAETRNSELSWIIESNLRNPDKMKLAIDDDEKQFVFLNLQRYNSYS